MRIFNFILLVYTMYTILVCVTEQQPMLFDTQNPGISGLLPEDTYACKYKTKRQAKMM